ncbi:hypothetical protein [Streptomyces hydrogenans]|uniref:hypothetical protein n=1 Tax=Streptomyces hydrogenans TaxID=1873719 RepID=UPI003810C095
MFRIKLARTLTSQDRVITDLHDRVTTAKTRAAGAEERIRQALALLDERGAPANDALRLLLTGRPAATD